MGRLIGSIRRECLDHVLILGERHVRRVLVRYFSYYHRARTHLSLDKDAPEVGVRIASAKTTVPPPGTKEPPMTKRTEKTGGTQGATTEATAVARLLAPLVDGMTTTRRQLLAWVQSAGLVALEAVFREEAAALAGPKGRHDPTRTHHHWGANAAAADVRGPSAEPVVSARAEPGGTGSGLAVGARLPGDGPVDDPDNGPASAWGLDARLCGEFGGRAGRHAESGDQQERWEQLPG